ncbi:MAG: hypothetical protein BWY42_01545 [Candidatus Omnitrophica bacterium ADurb.Bin277]|nr:MAG: hypothetical protein BWY42_01545 [Candidatus Omnitrophica bacterium ADurb.Bin277]
MCIKSAMKLMHSSQPEPQACLRSPNLVWFYRAFELIFFLLLILWATGGIPAFSSSLMSFFDGHPKYFRKLLVFSGGAAAITGIFLLEWARRDARITPHSFLSRMIGSARNASGYWTLGLFLIFGALWTASSLLRHAAFDSSFDMAIFTQAIWNTTRGDWFYSSIKGGISLLGDHFSPFLAVLALPYKIWPEPGFLLAIQAFSVASCVVPISRIVKRSGQSPAWAVLFCLLFILYRSVRNSVRFDFHPEVVAMPLLFWSFFFLEEKRAWRASLFLALALMAKENIAAVAFGLGVYALIKKEQQTGFGIFWVLASGIYLYFIVNRVIPAISGAPYAYLGGNFTEWIRLGWGPLATHLLKSSTFSYIAAIYGPLAFTSFLAPLQLILTLPILAQNLLSRNEMTRDLLFHYAAPLIPFVFISSVTAISKIRSGRRYWGYLLLITSVFMSGPSEVYPMRRMWIMITPHAREVAAMLKKIPAGQSLRTHEFFAPHAANRKHLHIFENNHPKEGGSWAARHTDLVAIDRSILKEKFDAALNELKNTGYTVSFERDGFVILEYKTGVSR